MALNFELKEEALLYIAIMEKGTFSAQTVIVPIIRCKSNCSVHQAAYMTA